MTHDVETRDDQTPDSPGELSELSALVALWKLFSSMKTAITLMLVLAAISMFGTFGKSGESAALFHSSWYALLLSLIGVNLVVCGINRFKMAWQRTFALPKAVSAEQLARMTPSETVTCAGDAESVANKVASALKACAYAVAIVRDDDAVTVQGVKGRLSIWGPYLTHLSLLVIFLGAIYGNRFGSEGFMSIAEGQANGQYFLQGTNQQQNLGFHLGLKQFTVTADDKHNPEMYRSDLQVFSGRAPAAGEQPVLQQSIEVNRPLTYQGYSFYQSDFGLASITLHVAAPDGEAHDATFPVQTGSADNGKIYQVPEMQGGMPPYQVLLFRAGRLVLILPHSDQSQIAPDYIGGTAINASYLPLNSAVRLFIHYPAVNGMESLGWVSEMKPVRAHGYTITLERPVRYTGLSVSRNPGLPYIYLGFGLMLLGIVTSFYITHKTIRARVTAGTQGVTVQMGGISRCEVTVFTRDFTRLRQTLEEKHT